MQQIAAVLGVTMSDIVASPTQLMTGKDEVEPIPIASIEPHIRHLAARGFRFYRVLADSVTALAIPQGATISVEESLDAIQRVQSLDVVLVEFSRAPSRPPVRVLRQFVAPSLLITNRIGHNVVIDMMSASIKCDIVGIVLRGA
jgi:hypothetical protein